MKLFEFFKAKVQSKDNKRLKEYEEGKVLQVDNNVDNKEFFKEK